MTSGALLRSTMGLAMVPLALVLGLAIDSGLAYAAKSRLQAAVDAAVLAGSQGFANDSATAAADARMFFDANYPNDYLSGHLVSFETGFDDATRAVTVYAEAIDSDVLHAHRRPGRGDGECHRDRRAQYRQSGTGHGARRHRVDELDR